MKATLRHIGVVSSNIEKSIDFYVKYFNFKVFNDQIETGNFISKILGMPKCKVRTVKLNNGNFLLELLDFGVKNSDCDIQLNTLGCTHIALTVNCLEKLYEDLKVIGVHFISPPSISDNKKALVCFMKDPYNNFFLELVETIENK